MKFLTIVLLNFMVLSIVHGQEYIFPELSEDQKAIEIAKIKEIIPNMELDQGYYIIVLQPDADSMINPRTYLAYGITPTEGWTIIDKTVKAGVSDVVLMPKTLDIRPFTLFVKGNNVVTNKFGCFIHFSYDVEFKWTESKGVVTQENSIRQKIESHHIMFPKSAIINYINNDKEFIENGIVINGRYFPGK